MQNFLCGGDLLHRIRRRQLGPTFSPARADIAICIIDVAAAEKIPRKGGPGITRSDLLVFNTIDLAPLVGANLGIMDSDSKRMRGERPYVFTDLKAGIGVDRIVSFIEQSGGLQPAAGDQSSITAGGTPL